jgi:hypothetical protein
MSEQIKSIESLDSFTFPGDTPDGYNSYEGWKIVTSCYNQEVQTIVFGVGNQSSCCESWGHTCSEDNPQDFVGADLYSVFVTDEGMESTKVKVGDVYDGGAVFVTLNTSKGKLQFAVYNAHNGYYGHQVKLVSSQTKYDGWV